MKNKYFVIPPSLFLEPISNVSFVFPLDGFCVGMTHTFSWDEIPDFSYVYINRLLDVDDFVKLKEHVSFFKNLKGIVFEDFGIYEFLKEENISIEKIFYASHANCSRYTVQVLLSYMDYVVLSPDITKEEVEEITSSFPKKIIFYTFGPLPYLYSRRTLITHYQEHFHEPNQNPLNILEPNHQKAFVLKENQYGTVCFDAKQLDGREFISQSSIYAFLICLDWMEIDSLTQWLKDFESGKVLCDTTSGFLHQKTIYRLPSRKES